MRLSIVWDKPRWREIPIFNLDEVKRQNEKPDWQLYQQVKAEVEPQIQARREAEEQVYG